MLIPCSGSNCRHDHVCHMCRIWELKFLCCGLWKTVCSAGGRTTEVNVELCHLTADAKGEVRGSEAVGWSEGTTWPSGIRGAGMSAATPRAWPENDHQCLTSRSNVTVNLLNPQVRPEGESYLRTTFFCGTVLFLTYPKHDPPDGCDEGVKREKIENSVLLATIVHFYCTCGCREMSNRAKIICMADTTAGI